jgi:hypothetical protein
LARHLYAARYEAQKNSCCSIKAYEEIEQITEEYDRMETENEIHDEFSSAGLARVRETRFREWIP